MSLGPHHFLVNHSCLQRRSVVHPDGSLEQDRPQVAGVGEVLARAVDPVQHEGTPRVGRPTNDGYPISIFYVYIYIYVYIFFYYILYTIYILIMYIICMYIYIYWLCIFYVCIYIYNRYIYILILIYAWWFKHQTWWFFMGFSESIIHPCRMWRPAISWLINPIHYINIILYYIILYCITLYYIVYIRINMGYVHTIHPS